MADDWQKAAKAASEAALAGWSLRGRPGDRSRMRRNLYGALLGALLIIGFTPQSAAQDGKPVGPGGIPIPTSPGEITWPAAIVIIAYFFKDKLPVVSITHTVSLDEQSRKCIEENVDKARRTFRHPLGDKEESDG